MKQMSYFFTRSSSRRRSPVVQEPMTAQHSSGGRGGRQSIFDVLSIWWVYIYVTLFWLQPVHAANRDIVRPGSTPCERETLANVPADTYLVHKINRVTWKSSAVGTKNSKNRFGLAGCGWRAKNKTGVGERHSLGCFVSQTRFCKTRSRVMKHVVVKKKT